MFLEKEDIANFDVISTFESEICCSICQSILIEPYQCSQCENAFCFNCINEWQKQSQTCPFKCPNFKLKEAKLIKQLLYKITFKCPNNCETNIPYKDYFDHIENSCPLLTMEMKNQKLKTKIKDICVEFSQMSRLRFMKPGKASNIKRCQVVISKHIHPLVFIKTEERIGWKCDICGLIGSQATYYCGLCDFDCCSQCQKKNTKTERYEHKHIFKNKNKKKECIIV